MTRLIAALLVALALPAQAETCPQVCRATFDPAVVVAPGPTVTPAEIAAALALLEG
jgi:hypothetical protein